MKNFLLAAAALFALLANVAKPLSAIAAKPDSVDVFLYHNGSPKEGLKVAWSVDGRQWLSVGDGFSVVKSDYGAWGRDKSMRNLSAVYHNGRFYAVWEVDDNEPQFATTYSDDLYLWKPQDYPYAKGLNGVKAPLLEVKDSRGVLHTPKNTSEAESVCDTRPQFTVSFQDNSGEAYRMVSQDFVLWSKPERISKADYDRAAKTVAITLKGRQVTGNCFRAAFPLIDNLQCRINDYNLRQQRNNERASGDAERFKGLSKIKATLTVNLGDKKPISDKLMGIFFEDINYAADGGLYAELVQNRDFEYSKDDRQEWNALSYWKVEGDLQVTIAEDDPIHENNRHYAVLKTTGAGSPETRPCRLINQGYGGIPIKKGERYDLSLFLKPLPAVGAGLVPARIKVKLIASEETERQNRSAQDTERILAQATLSASGKNWKQVKAVLTAKESAEKAVLVIEPQQEGTMAIDFVSLFPQKTFQNRKNGLRADLAQVVADLKPRFVRFPGGCLSHGNGIGNMYHWQETIGELWERKPQFNLWGYHQSKGLGFYEFFLFCEDIGAEPLPVLPAGVPCQNSSRGGKGQQGGIPMEEMEAYTQELLDLIEWANGDAKTSRLAALRAKAGHPKPFNLKMIGVGNEDIIGDVFKERFNYINRRIKQAYPDIEVVGTVGPFNEGSDYEFGWKLAREENIDIVDEHYYVQPGWFLHNQDYYDRYARSSESKVQGSKCFSTKVYLGEWASWGNTVENAVAEALHLTNVERNADIVVMASYAPLLARRGNTQWNTDLIYFNNTKIEPSVNYYVQKLFGENQGDEYIYSDLSLDIDAKYLDAADKRIARSVVRDTKTGDLILKLVNMTNVETDTEISLPGISGFNPTAVLTVLSGSYDSKEALPQTSTVTVSENFTHSLPPYSLNIIRIAF